MSFYPYIFLSFLVSFIHLHRHDFYLISSSFAWKLPLTITWSESSLARSSLKWLCWVKDSRLNLPPALALHFEDALLLSSSLHSLQQEFCNYFNFWFSICMVPSSLLLLCLLFNNLIVCLGGFLCAYPV